MFILKNEFEKVVCKISATLSWSQYDKSEPNGVYTQASHGLPSHIESSPIAIRNDLAPTRRQAIMLTNDG